MSTKTNFKRIALVAIAALGMSVVSSVPSQATVNTAAVITTEAGSATLAKSDSVTAAKVAVRFFTDGTASSNDSAVVTFSLGTQPATSSLTSANLMMTALDTSLSSGGASVLKGKGAAATAWATAGGLGLDSLPVASTTTGIITKAAVGNAYGQFGVFIDTTATRVAGTYSIDYVVRVYSGDALASTLGGSGSINIVVTDGTQAAAGAVSAAGTSKAVMKGGATWAASGDSSDIDSVVSAVNTPSSTTPSAVIRITQRTAASLPSRESITVTTNIGNVGNVDGTSIGKNVTFIGDTDGIQDIGVFADGTSGTATITIKTTSVTFTSKSVTFYSTTVASYSVVTLASVIGGSAANALLVVTKDATGNAIVTDTAAYAYSSDRAVIATGSSATTGTACTYSAAAGGQICSLSGAGNGTADITIRNASTVAASTVASTTPAKLTVNTALPAKVSLAFDKATYAPGEAAYIIVRAVDAAGNPVAPNATSTNLLATGGVSSTLAFGNGSETTTATAVNLRTTTASGDGYASTTAIGLYKVYMPAAGGTVKISATGGSALPAAGQVEVSATATVTDSGAAALAAVNALATTVASLRTLITTLTNLVLKIQKKVKA